MTSRQPYWCSKTENGGHIGVPSHSIFMQKSSFLVVNQYMAAGHVSENALYNSYLMTGLLCRKMLVCMLLMEFWKRFALEWR